MQDIYTPRRSRLAKNFDQWNIDAFLVTDPINVRYLCGFAGGDSFLLVGRENSILLTDSRFQTYLKEEMPEFPVYVRPLGESMIRAIEKKMSLFATKVKNTRVGVEGGSMTLDLFEHIRKIFVPVVYSRVIETLRMVKDRYEIAAIRRSAASAIKAFRYIQQNANPGWTEIDVRNELNHQMMLAGAEDYGFPTIVATAERAALPHAEPTNKRIGDGESFLIDWGAKQDGYISDLTRVLLTRKKISKKFRDIYETVYAAQQTAIQAIRPGVCASKIDGIARKVIEDAGYGKKFNHGLGHGLGLVVHDAGAFSVSSNLILKKGMILTVEPGIYLPGKLGVRIEDDILVTSTGAEVITKDLPGTFDEMFLNC